MNADKKYTWLLTALYGLVSVAGILRHELWLDEAHHYLMARDSHTLAELISVTRPDGHPILWNLLLFAITRFTHDVLAMQLLHVAIATTAVAVFLRRAPFSWLLKTLFIFGYFMIFEYGLISRNYMLGVLFLFLALADFEHRDKHFARLCLWLALAINSHVIFAAIAFPLFALLVNDELQRRRRMILSRVYGYAIFSIGVALLVMQLATTRTEWLMTAIGDTSMLTRLSKGVVALFKGLIMIPDFRTIHFWNVNLIIAVAREFAAVVSVLLFALPLVLFYRNRRVLFLVYAALAADVLLHVVTQRDGFRFYGISYLIIISGYWLSSKMPADANPIIQKLENLKLYRFERPVFYTIAIVHFISGTAAFAIDFTHPFTPSEQVAMTLKEKQLDRFPIMSITCEGTPVAPYLDKKIWFLCLGRYESYCRWESICQPPPNVAQTVALIEKFMRDHRHAVYVSYEKIPGIEGNGWHRLRNLNYKFVAGFDGNSIINHNYYIFEVAHAD